MESLKIKKTFWLLFIICIATILPFLGLSDYHTKGEPRESIVAYSMLESGNWILPRNNGGEMAYKPPFFHWCIASVSAVYGKVTEATSRIPSAIALIGMTLYGFVFFARRKGVKTALITSFITLTNFELHRAGLNCRVDMLLTALSVTALYLLYRWYEKGLKGLPWVAVLLMSLATLTKGPVGSIIPCLTMGIFLLLRGTGFFKALLLMSICGLLSFILPFSWYAAAYRQGGQEFLDLMMEENIGRMTNTMSYNSCVNPWPYNFVTLIAGYTPWTLLALLSLFGLSYRKINLFPTNLLYKFKLKIKESDPVNLFALASIIVIFVFYCIPQSKRSVYLMPIYPFIAYFLTKYLLYLTGRKAGAIKIYGHILAGAGVLLFILLLFIKSGLIPDSIFHGHRAQEKIDMLHGLKAIGGIGGWILVSLPVILGIYWWRYQSRYKTGTPTLFAVIALTAGLYLALDGAYQPAVLNAKSVKHVAVEINRIAPESEGVLYEFIAEGIHAAGDPIHYFEINFYLGNRVDNFYAKRPSSGFLLIGERDAGAWLPEFEAEGYGFELLYTTPKRVAGDIARLYKFRKKS